MINKHADFMNMQCSLMKGTDSQNLILIGFGTAVSGS
jgi:hypothetical protein